MRGKKKAQPPRGWAFVQDTSRSGLVIGFLLAAALALRELDGEWLAHHFIPGLLLVFGEDAHDLVRGLLAHFTNLLLHFLEIAALIGLEVFAHVLAEVFRERLDFFLLLVG